MSKEYDNYINEHVQNVRNGLEWMHNHVVGYLINSDKMQEALLHVDAHDQSKWSTEEYDAYDQHFYGEVQDYQNDMAFKYAWLHHMHNNPHHWIHWVLIETIDGFLRPVALEMPLEYVYEMIADWWSFSWRNGNLMEIFNWYAEHVDKMILHPNTKETVERILSSMYYILARQLMLYEFTDNIPTYDFIKPFELITESINNSYFN